VQNAKYRLQSEPPAIAGPKSEIRSLNPEDEGQKPTPENGFATGLRLLTRDELAAVLRVSPRTVQEMVSGDEIPVVRIRGAVRFYLPDVVRCLTATAVTSKRGCSRKLQAPESDAGILTRSTQRPQKTGGTQPQ
jgi:excisionase family DNA binding protein